jgi:hypothetical protein
VNPAPTQDSGSWHGAASTEDALWHITPAPVPAAFQVKWDKANLTFGELTASVLLWEETNGSIGVFARPNALNLQIVFNVSTGKGTWTLSGEAGQASGSLSVEQ